jgi:hypothetical protein
VYNSSGSLLATLAKFNLNLNSSNGQFSVAQIVTFTESYDLFTLFNVPAIRTGPYLRTTWNQYQKSLDTNEWTAGAFIIEDSRTTTKNLDYFDARTTKKELETDFTAGTNAHLSGVTYQLTDGSGAVVKIVQMTADVAAGTVPVEGTNYKVLLPQTIDFTAIDGYDSSVQQTLEHDSSGAVKWVNNA